MVSNAQWAILCLEGESIVGGNEKEVREIWELQVSWSVRWNLCMKENEMEWSKRVMLMMGHMSGKVSWCISETWDTSSDIRRGEWYYKLCVALKIGVKDW